MSDEALCVRPAAVQAKVQAWRYRDTLRAIEFAPVISGGNNDDPPGSPGRMAPHMSKASSASKKPLFNADTHKTAPTRLSDRQVHAADGLWRPIEGVMYLDRPSARPSCCKPLPA